MSRAYEKMEQMLSNIEVILLNIVNEKPSYAYEIDKTIELREMKRWVRIGSASIYRVLIKLEKKGLVYSRREKEGKMPERKRYYITEPGKAALAEAAKKLLSQLEWYYLDLNVGFEASDGLTADEIVSCLQKRLTKVKSNIRGLQEIYNTEQGLSEKKRIIIKNLIYIRGAEEKILEEAIHNIATHGKIVE
ncbi:MAG: PadR family transcriptional regulator [Pelotomaculum sp.]|jgi:DNA-binding PadR family transcriptional regulator